MSLITTSIDARGVATLTLNRPDKHNALDGATMQELHAALVAINGNAQARVVVLTGAGASFCAGADIAHMRSMMGATEQQNVDDALLLVRCLRALDELDKPVIARVNGNVFGGGVGLVACADIAIAVETAKFALTEVRLGIVPAAISPYVVAAIGNRNARRLFLTGAPFDALEARSLGLLHFTASAEQLDAAVAAHRSTICCVAGRKRCAPRRSWCDAWPRLATAMPGSTLWVKKLHSLLARLRVSPEGREGLSAFLERRKPNWHPGE